MLTCAKAHAAEAGVSERIRFVQASATKLPFDAGTFDLVILHFTLHHVDHSAVMFDEAARVVRGSGKVIIKDLRWQPRWKAALLLAFAKYVLGYSSVQLQMCRESMNAALSLEEPWRAMKISRLSMATIRGFRGLDFIINS